MSLETKVENIESMLKQLLELAKSDGNNDKASGNDETTGKKKEASHKDDDNDSDEAEE